MADTFQRSLDHWSESGRREMEDFYALASVDYRHLAEAKNWKSWFEERQDQAGSRPLELLDVACGAGKFPAALLNYAALGTASIKPVAYALLDPSSFSISEARKILSAPFEPSREYPVKLQDLDCDAGSFDIVWAIHALYAVPVAELSESLERFLHALSKDGAGFIAHACADAHYLSFYQLFLDAFYDGNGTPFTSAEQVENTLQQMGANIHVRDIRYNNSAPERCLSQVEGYLQRCVFDDVVSLDQMLEHPVTGDYLRNCLVDGQWRFKQRVKLIFIGS